MTNALLSQHPLHASIIESFDALRMDPDEQQASFTATLSRILTDAFIVSDPACSMPAFLTDRGVQVLRFAVDDHETDIVPGAEAPVGQVISQYLDEMAANPDGAVTATSGKFALCSAFDTLADLLANPVLMAGGILGFNDPIYEDGLILIRISLASQADWHFRMVDQAQAA